jgi:hypothetical protein
VHKDLNSALRVINVIPVKLDNWYAVKIKKHVRGIIKRKMDNVGQYVL